MKYALKIAPLILLYTFYSLTGLAQPNGLLSVKGKDIVGADGKPFLLKGTNLGNWLVPEGYMFKFKNTNSPSGIARAVFEILGPEEAAGFWRRFLDNYITESDIQFLQKIGVNSIRLPFNYKLFTQEDYLGTNDANRGFAIIDRLIGWCKKANLYIILDMHCAPGGQTGDNIDDSYGYPYLFTSEACKIKTIAIWTAIAKRYRKEKIIAGYDLLNEPVAHYFDVTTLNPFIEPFYKQLVTAIRAVDKNHIIFLGGAQWNTNFKIFSNPFDTKLVYTFHKYGDQPDLGSVKRFIEFRDKYNVPIYAGETGENTNEWVGAFRKVLDENHIGWHFWPYKKIDSPKNMVSIPMPAGYDSLIKFVESPRDTYKNIRAAMGSNAAELKKQLYLLLDNLRFSTCLVNTGYVAALGLGENKTMLTNN